MARRSSNTLAELVVGVLSLLLACELEVNGQAEKSAICTIEAGSGVADVYGTVKLYHKNGSEIRFEVALKGFGSTSSQHGFHIHQEGNLGQKCNESLGHYNPDGVDHGAPTDAIRHVGDLGNVQADAAGEVNVNLTDRIISLFGNRTVIGRAFVVHQSSDDLGKGNFSDSKTTGHAGARYGCCIIIQETTGGAGNRWSDVQPTVIAVLFLVSLISIY